MRASAVDGLIGDHLVLVKPCCPPPMHAVGCPVTRGNDLGLGLARVQLCTMQCGCKVKTNHHHLLTEMIPGFTTLKIIQMSCSTTRAFQCWCLNATHQLKGQ